MMRSFVRIWDINTKSSPSRGHGAHGWYIGNDFVRLSKEAESLDQSADELVRITNEMTAETQEWKPL